jgi:hypothetical protein
MIEERIFFWAAACRYSYKPQANGIVRATWQSDEFKKFAEGLSDLRR